MQINKTKKIIIGVIVGIIVVVAVVVPTVLTVGKSKSNSVEKTEASFYVIPLGATGGLEEDNLSSYLLTLVDNTIPDSIYISLDGGTIRHGLTVAIQKKSLPTDTDVETFFQEQIKAYFISHGHLDHNSGFILNSPNDKSGKTIIAINETINIIQKHYFNDQAWADFGPAGLQKYKYEILNPFSSISIPIVNTKFNVRAFRLCHTCPFLSSAILVSRNDQPASILYLGDTGPDDVEKIINNDNTTYFPRYLNQLWKEMTPLVVQNQLKAIFIEVSFPNERPDHLLFGHLTPKWLVKELNVLRNNRSMENVTIIITHIKPEKGAREKIIEQIKNEGGSHFNFIFPEQGRAIWL